MVYRLTSASLPVKGMIIENWSTIVEVTAKEKGSCFFYLRRAIFCIDSREQRAALYIHARLHMLNYGVNGLYRDMHVGLRKLHACVCDVIKRELKCQSISSIRSLMKVDLTSRACSRYTRHCSYIDSRCLSLTN